MVTSMASFGGATLRGELNPAEQRYMASQLRVYLGISLLETNDFKMRKRCLNERLDLNQPMHDCMHSSATPSQTRNQT
jgi:hypothetical protein